MAGDTVTLALQGETVTLDQFAQGLAQLSTLMGALSAIADAPDLRWEIDDLATSSAIATVRAASLNGYRVEHVERVTNDYLAVARALKQHVALPYPKSVQEPARNLADLTADGVEAILFQTAAADVFVSEPAKGTAPEFGAKLEASPRLGEVTGRIQMVSSRSKLRFTLYDRFYDKAVSCYLSEGSEGIMRNAWNRMARVQGIVSRDPMTGRPIGVRQVDRVEILPESDLGAYRRARGAVSRRGRERAELRIRRIRDAE